MERFDEETAKDIARNRWNDIYSKYERDKLVYDDWLDLFGELIKECKTSIIDLGCGIGNNTLYLLEKGKQVIPCDYSERAIENIANYFPEIQRKECFDMAKGFPFPDNFTDIMIADLSLHYFSKKVTRHILEDIKRVLKPNGVLIFRVNSVKDVNHGAGDGIEVEKHFYKTSDGRYKRFFDENDIKDFFIDWDILYMKEEQMGRYEKSKELWRCAVKINKLSR